MERQIAARDPAVFADIEPELEQLFLTPGQRLAPPGIGNTMGLMMALASGVAGVMGLMADMAFALTDVSPAAALLGSGAILAVWMTLILLQLTQGKNSGVLLLKYYLLLLPVALLAALFAWGMGVSGFFSVVLLLAGTAGGFIFSHRTIFICMWLTFAVGAGCLSNGVGRWRRFVAADSANNRRNHDAVVCRI